MAVPIPKLTVEEYLEIEREAEYKSEYFNGEMFAMAGASLVHNELGANLIWALKNRLRGSGCKVYTSDQRTRTEAKGLYTYADVSVVCGERMLASDKRDVLTNPKVIFEVLSPSTERKDRGFKFDLYKKIESLEEYVLVSQFEPRIERYRRPPGGTWSEFSDSIGLDALLTLKSLGIEIPLAEIYEDVQFEVEPKA